MGNSNFGGWFSNNAAPLYQPQQAQQPSLQQVADKQYAKGGPVAGGSSSSSSSSPVLASGFLGFSASTQVRSPSLAEHDEGWSLTAAMTAAASHEMKGQEFADAARAYITHLTAHIEKENHVLFPMADRIIKPEVMKDLAEAFDPHEEQVIGHGRHEQLHQLLKDLKKRYLAE